MLKAGKGASFPSKMRRIRNARGALGSKGYGKKGTLAGGGGKWVRAKVSSVLTEKMGKDTGGGGGLLA